MTSKAEQIGSALGKAFKKTAVKVSQPVAYYIGQHVISDRDAFDIYLAKTLPFIAKHGGRYLTKGGGFRWVEVFARHLKDASGEIAGAYGTLNDVTEQFAKSTSREMRRTSASVRCSMTRDLARSTARVAKSIS